MKVIFVVPCLAVIVLVWLCVCTHMEKPEKKEASTHRTTTSIEEIMMNRTEREVSLVNTESSRAY